jgi:hypothetical protein
MTTLDLYTRRSDGEDRILEHLTLKMRLPTKKPGESPASDPLPSLDRTMPELEFVLVGDTGIEPVTSTVSR